MKKKIKGQMEGQQKRSFFSESKDREARLLTHDGGNVNACNDAAGLRRCSRRRRTLRTHGKVLFAVILILLSISGAFSLLEKVIGLGEVSATTQDVSGDMRLLIAYIGYKAKQEALTRT